MLTKPEFLKQYLLANSKERIKLNDSIVKSGDWLEYYPTYTADKIFKGTLAEFVAIKLFHDKGHKIEMSYDNQFVLQYGDPDINLENIADFKINGIRIEIKQTDHLVGNGFALLAPKIPDYLVEKAKAEEAQLLYVFDFKHYTLMQRIMATGQETTLDNYSKDSLKAIVEQIKCLALTDTLSYDRFSVKM